MVVDLKGKSGDYKDLGNLSLVTILDVHEPQLSNPNAAGQALKLLKSAKPLPSIEQLLELVAAAQ